METLDEPSFIQTLLNRKKEVLIGSSSVIAGIALLIGYFQSGPDAQSYLQAEEAFAKWEQAPLDEDLYGSLRGAMKKVPALGVKYEATIAQKLLDSEKIDEALGMANRSISRVQDIAPFHSDFARTSLLIGQKKYQQALERAVALKELLSKEDSESLLYAHNLIRIACLQQELKNSPGEKSAWEELETYLASSSHSDLVLSNFSEKELGLTHYIAERKKSL